MTAKSIIRYGAVSILIFAGLSLHISARASQKLEAADYYHEGILLMQEAENDRKENNTQSALKNYRAALEKFVFINELYPEWEPKDTPVSLLIKDCDEAIRLCEAASGINWGHFYLAKHRYEDAIAEYRAVLNEYSDQAESCATARAYLGTTYFQLGNYKDALDAYQSVLDMHRDYRQLCAQALAGIGEIYRITGRYEEARNAFQQLTAQYPDSLQAQIMGSMSDVFPVESWQDEIDQSTDAEAAAGIVQEFLSGQISQKVFEDSLIALDEKNENDVFYVVGLKYQMTGNPGKAKEYYQKCVDISIDKGDKDAAYKMALKALENLNTQP